MNLWTKHIGLFVWVVAIYVIGILLFSRGFLLKRIVIEKNSTCETDFTHSDHHGKGGCWMHPAYKKAVILVIDALRFDFVAKSKNSTEVALPFENKLTVVQDALETDTMKSRLYRFIADPPTTTMQRIKGLTTGSLPTFVDVGANFASEEITEDNFIDQLIKTDKNVVFMGDDTWTGLFPNRFLTSYHYPSLNVKDLDTVDNGILEHLIPEMQKKDWDVLIAHFLGVDHCGHTFGPYHSVMEDKLTQMNAMISNVMSELDDDTLLVLLGDHGMTRTGDHGGDSPDELEAALFMYSKKQLSATSQDSFGTVRQIDLVPTLSLLLGAPIPYSNLGMVIPDLFNYCPWWKDNLTPIKQKYHTVKALHLNAHQLHQYLQTYGEVTGEFAREKYAELEWLFQTTEEELQELVTAIANGETPDTLTKLKQLEADYVKYMESARSMCQDIWAKFDLGSMVLGAAAVIKALFLSVFLYNTIESKAELSPHVLAAVSTSVWAVLLFTFLSVLGLKLAGMIAALVTGIGVIALFGFILFKVTSNSQTVRMSVKQPSKKLLYFSIGIMVLHNLSLFSNSFVVFEDSVTAFFAQSLAWAMLLTTLQTHAAKHKPTSMKKFDLGRVLTSPYFILFALALVFCACVRLSAVFRACREEQTSPEWICEISVFLQPLAALSDQPYKNVRYFLSLGMLLALVGSTRLWLRHQGNMNGDAWSIQCVRYALPIMAVCIALYWALLSAPQKVLDRLPPWQLTILPRVAYVMCGLTVLVVWIKPLCVLLVKRDNKPEAAVPMFSQDDLVPNVYSHIKQHWKQHYGEGKLEKPRPLAYGLASVYSAAVLVFVLSVVLLCALLLGDGLAPTMTLLVLALFFLLELHASYCHLQPMPHESRFDVPFCSVLLLSLVASTFFFATGHQTTIANIHWHPAFVGFHGNHDVYAIPAFLISMETFSAFVACGLALPLLVCWPRIRGRLAYVFEKKESVQETEMEKKGEFVLNEDYIGLWTAMFRLLMAVLVIHGSKVLCAMLCAAVHRRHLMVWKIFAPRFVYEGATFLVVCVVCLVDLLFVLRVDKSLDSWVKKINAS